MDEKRRVLKRRIRNSVLAVVGVALLIWVGLIVDAYFDIKSTGLLDKVEMRTRDGTSVENMRALHTALTQYYTDEGVMPEASGWMDAAENYIHAADLPESEAMKVFVDPNLPAGNGVFGYALNSELGGAYTEDLQDAVMIFESADTSWNAHGAAPTIASSPDLAGGRKGITVAGVVVDLRNDVEDEN